MFWKVYLCQKYCCTLLLCAKDNFSAAISCLIISRTFLANNYLLTIFRGEVIPYTTDYMNNAICKRTSYIQTYLVNIQYFISVRTCHFSRKPKCWLRGGVCGQFPKNLNRPKHYQKKQLAQRR